MGRRDAPDPDGLPSDDVGYYPADAPQMQSYATAAAQLSRLEVPLFVHADNPHERVFVASFDGTSSDKSGDPARWTNVAKIDGQIERLARGGEIQFGRGYVPGPGTGQTWLSGPVDALEGHSVKARAETMYRMFAEQARDWLLADPDAQIRVAGVGFSRGTGAEAIFHRMVQERGILDPSTATYQMDRDGLVQQATYPGPPLVPPGQVAQAAVLFDPVNTGIPMEHDRRLPPSVLTGIQIIAMDERRSAFKADRIIDPGWTFDGRFLGMAVAGAHGDIGGNGDARDGLAARNANLAIDFLNGLSDRPYLSRVSEPEDPHLNVVHRSEQGSLVYQVFMPKVNRANPNGQNQLLVSDRDIGKVADPYNAEPRDEALNAQFEHRPVGMGRPIAAASVAEKTVAAELFCRLDRMQAAANADDWAIFQAENRALAFGAAGRAMWDRAGTSAVNDDLLRVSSLPQPLVEAQAPPRAAMAY